MLVIVGHLPPRSAFKTELRGYEHWDLPTELLAQISHSSAVANWQRMGSKATQARYPKPVPRPWDEFAKRMTAANASLNRSGILGTPVPMAEARARLFSRNGRAPQIRGVPNLPAPVAVQTRLIVSPDPLADALEATLDADLARAGRSAAAIGHSFPGRMFPR